MNKGGVRRFLPRRPVAVVAALALLTGASVGAGLVYVSRREADDPTKLPVVKPTFLAAGCSVQTIAHLPEEVYSLLAYGDPSGLRVVAGTGPVGGVYIANPKPPYNCITLAEGLGDSRQFGITTVNALAAHDLDRDGNSELIAVTNQDLPVGQPRVYVWDFEGFRKLRGVAFAEIASSWSHGIGFGVDRATGHGTILSTYCGHGEVMEYRLATQRSRAGFVSKGLAGRQIGQLPGSGEQLMTADVDNDGRPDLIVASGFRIQNTEIQIYRWEPGRTRSEGSGVLDAEWKRLCVIDEEHRFGNVRFAVGDLEGDGVNEIVAWWCTDLLGGDYMLARYRIGASGVESRQILHTGPAEDYWPVDGQMAVVDVDGDGVPEVWFAVSQGKLWRLQPGKETSGGEVEPQLIAHFAARLGPIAASARQAGEPQRLFLSVDHDVVRLDMPRRESGLASK